MRRYGNLVFGGLLVFLILSAGGWQRAAAAPIPFNSLLVYRVGDGSAPLTDAAAPVFMDAYDFSGALLQTIAIPSSGPNSLTAVGNDPTEGLVSHSRDLRAFYFTGYRKDAGGANPAADASATTKRVLGNVRLSGAVDTSVAVVDAPTGAVRSAASDDGSEYWYATEGGMRYVGAPVGASTSTGVNSLDSRQVVLNFGNALGGTQTSRVLYASNSSTETAEKVQLFSPLPTGAATSTPVVTLTSADAVHGFVIFDNSASVPGPDLLYVLSTSEGLLRRYLFDGTTWQSLGSRPTSASSITGYQQDGYNLFLTSPTEIQSLNDKLISVDVVGGPITTLASAGMNTAFRGLSFTFGAGVPEPPSFTLATALLLFYAPRFKKPKD